MTTPRVAVGLFVYTGEGHLAATINSLLSQTMGDFVLDISDNASTDLTEERCRSYAATEHAEMKLEPLQAVRSALGEGAGRNRLAQSRVLITGASGFLGRALTGALGPMEVVGPTRRDVDLLEGAMTVLTGPR
jgi:GT2 family glycosyltransferase